MHPLSTGPAEATLAIGNWAGGSQREFASVLPHMDFGAVALELHLVHQLVDQVNAAAVVGVDVLSVTWVGDGEGVEA
jgi:hypothetical protein